MEWADYLGLLAGICTTAAIIPQIKKAWRTKKVDDVSPAMFFILMSGVLLWLIYGILKNDLPIMATNGVSLVLNSVMLYLMVRYRAKS